MCRDAFSERLKRMKFYVGQLLRHLTKPGIFRVLAVNDKIQVVKYLGRGDFQPFWASKAVWEDAHSS